MDLRNQSGSILALRTRREHAGALAETLRARFELEPVEVGVPESPCVFLELYLPDGAAAERIAAAAADLPGILKSSVRHYEARDWAESWKHHFRAADIGRRLRVAPPWEAGSGPAERIEVIVNPGLSFGTGLHFTTRFCLESLEDAAARFPGCGFADLGTGSGVLAVAAARLGFRPVLGTDYDPQCIESARDNAARNGVERALALQVHELGRDGPLPRHEVVCANILSSVLLRCAPQLKALTGSLLILSGIREEEIDRVSAAFYALGAQEEVRDGDGRWAGLIMRF
ncbi:50S ribosomal protein L11 methyltransferase [Kiritimatiella glycovorans]|uniref:Ribosomal protein L11 methyltransferase n=1 Tax=Kiritimatiella glycovorans TaxID=1307763 RepID=A0A0G3EEN5_9BACT|nr:50S ribosomal protein L11 methyltransferase [Kiritimatiella glycovorans]AKJ63827.1 Ribosomal protein L11 methyltransferase [Kiritimatiella glycovorans]